MTTVSCPQCQATAETESRFCPQCGFPLAEFTRKPEDPLLGKTFPGGYVLLELIGIGGMGRVYRAEQKALGRTVAVKVIHPHLHGEEGAAARFITEARAASRLNHPNVVSVIDFGRTPPTDGNLLYLVMEFLRGRDLGRVAYEEGPLPFPRIVDILKQTLSALDEAHHLGIIHRDVKPENIVLETTRGGADFVKVVDFGLAKLRPDQMIGITRNNTGITSPGIVCGTPDFMSPEQGRGDPLDPRSDLYALGVVMYQLLTGRLPFEAASPTQVVLMHLQQRPLDPRVMVPERRIPDPVAEVCLRAMEKDRNLRFADAQAFIKALDETQVRPVSNPAVGQSVICVQCQATIPAGKKFCSDCGAKISSLPITLAPTLAVLPTPADMRRIETPYQTRRSSISQARLTLPLPLLGRDDDLAWLEDRRTEADGSIRGARLVGEAGAGKTRLLSDFLSRARSNGDTIIEIAPDPGYAEVGYYGLADALEKLTGISRSTDLTRRKWVGPNADDVRVGISEITGRGMGSKLSSDARRWAVANAFRWALQEASTESHGRRVVVSIDDLPRHDGGSRHAIADVLGEPPNCSVLVIATHGPGFDATWPSGRSLARMLGGLSTSLVSSVLRGIGPSVSSSAVQRLLETSNRGVLPLYLEQLTRLGLEGGGAPPGGVADLIAMRLERSGRDVRRLLQAAAVIGDEVSPASVSELLIQVAPPADGPRSMGKPQQTEQIANVEATLTKCVAAGFLVATDLGHSFAHPLFREVAASTIPAGVRRELHARAAELAQERGAPIEERAMHEFEAQNALEALMLLEQVADRSTQRGDDDGAILALRRCLDLARRALFRGDIDEPDRAVVIFSRKLAEVLARAGFLTDAEGILREALDLAGPADTGRARLLELLAHVARARDRRTEANTLLTEAIATASRSGARELLLSLRKLETTWGAA